MQLQDYIDLGWYTVPLEGKLERLKDGTKTIPIFPKGWKDKYSKTKNRQTTNIGMALTGKLSDIIAIDCDNENAYEIFRTLDPNNTFVFESVGKTNKENTEIKTGTIIYRYTPELNESFAVRTRDLIFDFFSSKGACYLPTSANKTKKPLNPKKHKLRYPPPAIIALLSTLRLRTKHITDDRELSRVWEHNLAPLLKMFVSERLIIPRLFKIITPKDFRGLSQYIKNGHLVPEDVPQGRGSEYLSKVSCILGADSSVNKDLYTLTMQTLNNFFSEPMDESRLLSTIIRPMLEETVTIAGDIVWRYDENWAQNRCQYQTKRHETVDNFYESRRREYYCVNAISEQVLMFENAAAWYNHLQAVALDSASLNKSKTVATLPLVDVISTPTHPFGFFKDRKLVKFNKFSMNDNLAVFKNPELYQDLYQYPTNTLEFLKILIPNPAMRNYVLKFLRTKLDTFAYSAVILYFLGASGAGKDLFFRIISLIMGEDNVATPVCSVFMEKHNGWLPGKFFVQLDEYGDQLVKFNEKQLVLGKLKAYSGKETIQVRKMGTDGYQEPNEATFILTANKNPLIIQEDDRRFAYIHTPNILKNHPWVQQQPSLTYIVDNIVSEVKNFCYYLATQVTNLDADSYQTPPVTPEKHKLISESLGPSGRIAYWLSNQMFDLVLKEADNYNIELFVSDKLFESALFELYSEMTNFKGTKKTLASALEKFVKRPTTYKGIKQYYYVIPGLDSYYENTLREKALKNN